MIILIISCLWGNLWSQQSNPFDIIKTGAKKISPIITPQQNDSVVINSTQIETLSDTSVAKANPFNNQDSTIGLVEYVNEEVKIDNSNPFNIVKTSDKAGRSVKSSPSIGVDEIEKPNPQTIDQPTQKESSWIPKLVPRKEGLAAESSFSLNFIFWIIIASLLVLATVINLKRKSFLNLYRAITNDNYLRLLQREENNGFTFFFLLLYIIFLLNVALYIYQLLINKFEIVGYKLYLTLFASVFVIYLIRYIGIFVLQICFPLKKEARQFNFTIIMFNIIVGLLLIPLNILIAYASFGPTMVYTGLGVIAFFYLLRQLRGLFIAARTKDLSYFHFFIYLCTFEVAPIFWLVSFLNY